jgi:hypothetical protein
VSNSELEPLVEGTIVDDRPFVDVQEAAEFMTKTLALLRHGVEVEEQGQQIQQEAASLLVIGARREVWRPLGFDSWEECLTHGFAATFNISIPRAARIPLVVELRHQGVSTKNIAKAVDVHTTTVMRDLQIAREDGLLEEEPAKVVGGDGRARPTVEPTRRRPEFGRSWNNAMHAMGSKVSSISRMRLDDRYPSWLPELAVRHRGDLERWHTALGQILKDFEIIPPATHDPEN